MIVNLSSDNIRRDEGCISISVVRALEKNLHITLPVMYINFIVVHNGARLRARFFNYVDSHTKEVIHASISFSNFEQIINDIRLLQSNNDNSDMMNYFADGLIPFGDTGGGDMICFDYRNNKKTDNPPIVLWNHEIGFKDGVFFIAPNFEAFINMLHEPNDED